MPKIKMKRGETMPRPKRCRRICRMPQNHSFGPIDGEGNIESAVIMTVDEFEAIRLIDLEGLSQEQCAERMNVARTTAQAIYNNARSKLAKCLVHGMMLEVRGGNYALCEEAQPGCGCCHRRCENTFDSVDKNWRKTIMKIAVSYENGQIFQHFGHTERFKIYEVEQGKVRLATTVNTNGSGHGALADILKKLGVDTLICGGIGGGARRALAEAGIQLYGGVTGDWRRGRCSACAVSRNTDG